MNEEDKKDDFICSKKLKGREKCDFQCERCAKIQKKSDANIPKPKRKSKDL